MSSEEEAAKPLSPSKDGKGTSVRGRKQVVVEELSSAADFFLFAACLYIVFVAAFERQWTAPLSPVLIGEHEHGNSIGKEAVTNTTEEAAKSVEVPPVDYAAAVASVVVVLISALGLGRAAEWATGPPLLGMLLAGIALRNVPFTGEALAVPQAWSSFLRRSAFVVILLRGGLSLDARALRRMKGACLRLALLPCSAEAIAVMLAARLVFGLPLLFGLLLGSVLAAVSPAVVVPAMIRIGQQGLDPLGVSSLIVAAASLDDVYAITVFSVTLGIVFATGDSIVLSLVRAPLEVVGGVVLGGAIGWTLGLARPAWRIPLLCSCAAATFFGCARLGVDSSGALAVLVAAFVVGGRWRDSGATTAAECTLRSLWDCFFQPALFGLIGFELSFRFLSLRLVLLGLLVLAVGVAVRTAVAFVATFGSSLPSRARFFVALAWTPKATVQAALAPVALELVRRAGDTASEEAKEGARVIFALAVLSILTTAPIGAALIRVTAKRLLASPIEAKEEGVEEGKMIPDSIADTSSD